MTSVLILGSGFSQKKFFLEDDNDPGNGVGQFRPQGVDPIFFDIPTEFLTAAFGNDQKLVMDLGESFGAAGITVGSLADASVRPESITVGIADTIGTVTLTTVGFLAELGADADVDLFATSLLLMAGTGVGLGGALEVQAGTLEAETDTGGIDISVMGGVTIGGAGGSADMRGLNIESSGNLSLTATGTITLADEDPGAFETVKGGAVNGNVKLTAVGANSDIVSSVDQDSIAAPGGKIEINAGRDISLGTLGVNFDNDVRANDEVKLIAGRDINIDGFADIASDGYGASTGGDLICIAGRDINILASTGVDASIGADGTGGADTRLTAGHGAFVRALASSSATIFSNSGNVIIEADRVVIAASSGVTATSGAVTLRTHTAGWQVDLGSAADGAFAMELSDAELDRIFSPSLTIGDARTGKISVTTAINPASATDLTLRSGSTIQVAVGGSLATAGALTLVAADHILLAPTTISAGGAFEGFVDFGDSDAGVGGKALVDAGLSQAVHFTGAGDNDTLQGGAGADTLEGGGGDDLMTGRIGDDIYVVSGGDTVIELVDEGVDTFQGAGNVTLIDNIENLTLIGTSNNAGTGNDVGNLITGNTGNNALAGGKGNDTINGGDGKDSIDGGKDKDRINGGEGNDTIGGGLKNDRLAGGGGADSFLFVTTPDSAANNDLIQDFNPVQDTILLDDAIFTSLAPGTLPGSRFHIGAAAADGNDFIIYDSATGALLYDADADQAGAAVQFAAVAAGLAMTNADFVVV